jgi:glycosyltransferase involved in cell wall biosynthesis
VTDEWKSKDRVIEVTVLMPCLNEAKTLGPCILEAKAALASMGLSGEVLIADNGSSDSSVQVSMDYGARVISVSTRGYGAALRQGIESSNGEFVIIGDADQSYDFFDLRQIVRQLQTGDDLVIGNRFSGGIEKGAMPFVNRYIGNPVLSYFGRKLFTDKVKDFHCGLRGLRKSVFMDIPLMSDGMEFASELIAEAALAGRAISEVPVKLRRDGRDRRPHLRRWRDGTRHLSFLMARSSTALMRRAGIVVYALGATLAAVLYFGPIQVNGRGFGFGAMLFSLFLANVGSQVLILGRVVGALRTTDVNTQTWSIMMKSSYPSRTLRLAGVFGAIWILIEIVVWILHGLPSTSTAESVRRVAFPISLLMIWLQFTTIDVAVRLFERNLKIKRRSEDLSLNG